MTAVHDHDLIFNNEEAVIAVLRKDVDQNWECRHGDDAHGRRNNGARVDGEVHAIDVRRVSGRQHGLLDCRLLLCGYLGPRTAADDNPAIRAVRWKRAARRSRDRRRAAGAFVSDVRARRGRFERSGADRRLSAVPRYSFVDG